MFKVMAIGAAAMSLLAPPTWSDSPDPATAPPGKITVDLVTINGSGCPTDTATVAVNPDNTAFTISYSEYIAETGPGIKKSAARKNCQINVRVNAPQGFTYAVAEVDYRGALSLEDKATAVQGASYYFQGSSDSAYRSHPLKADKYGNWHTSDKTDLAAVVWAPCGAKLNLNVNTDLQIKPNGSNPASSSWVAMDSTDGSVDTIYHLSWKKCPGK
jgi:hypothetical protein